MASPHREIFSVFVFLVFLVSVPPPWGLLPGFRALSAGSEALLAGSEAFPAGFKAHPSGSETLPASSEALLAYSEALPTGSKALLAGSEALPTGSELRQKREKWRKPPCCDAIGHRPLRGCCPLTRKLTE